MIFILSIIFFILDTVILFLIDKKIKENKKHQEIETKIQKQNEEIKKQNEKLIQEKEQYNKEINLLKNSKNNMIEIAKDAYIKFCETLDKQYEQKEEEYDKLNEQINTAYNNLQDQLQTTYNQKQEELSAAAAQVQAELDKMKNTRAAAIQAQLKEEEIKKEKEFYSLSIPLVDINDTKILREIEYKLNNPRVLRMLIWSNFYQKPMTQLCNNVVGTTVKTGIYKITNQLTDVCYIGQAVDIAERWKKHAKCGLGIDTPVSSKLYQAMIKDGLENFTFEILEECSKAELDEKEKFYIELYQAKEYRL